MAIFTCFDRSQFSTLKSPFELSCSFVDSVHCAFIGSAKVMALVGSSQSRLAFILFDLILYFQSCLCHLMLVKTNIDVFNTDLSVRASKWPSADGVYGEVKC